MHLGSGVAGSSAARVQPAAINRTMSERINTRDVIRDGQLDNAWDRPRFSISKLPSPAEEGKAATSNKNREASLIGADGVVWSRKLLGHTTPSARTKVASRLLLDRASTPPRLRRGACSR